MKPIEQPPTHLWSSPAANRENVEQLTALLVDLKLSPTEIAKRQKIASERVQAFKTGVSYATLASRTD